MPTQGAEVAYELDLERAAQVGIARRRQLPKESAGRIAGQAHCQAGIGRLRVLPLNAERAGGAQFQRAVVLQVAGRQRKIPTALQRQACSRVDALQLAEQIGSRLISSDASAGEKASLPSLHVS